MARDARDGKKSQPAEDEAEFRHSSRHVDLVSLLGDHMLDAAAAAATADWYPSRRGNSPRNRDRGKRLPHE
jgi:hypothetical protein